VQQYWPVYVKRDGGKFVQKKCEAVNMMRPFNAGDRVHLSGKVLHAEFRGLCGTVVRSVKSRGVVVIHCDNGKRYDAFPENVELLSGETS